MYKFFRMVGVTLFTLTVSLCFLWSVAVASSLNGCGGEVVESNNLPFEQQVVELVNQARTEQGLAPLKFNATLTNAARYLAKDMALDDYFAHDTYDRDQDQLVRICKWSERIQKYYAAPTAENVAAGYASPASVVQAWLESQGHRTNILNDYREIGVGYYASYWVQDFGKQSDVYPLIINNEAITTAALDVNLYMYGAWEQIRLRNDEGEWSAWQPFQNQLTWRLQPEAGLHIVTAEVQSGATTAGSRDEIEVTDTWPTGNETSELVASLLFLPILQR